MHTWGLTRPHSDPLHLARGLQGPRDRAGLLVRQDKGSGGGSCSGDVCSYRVHLMAGVSDGGPFSAALLIPQPLDSFPWPPLTSAPSPTATLNALSPLGASPVLHLPISPLGSTHTCIPVTCGLCHRFPAYLVSTLVTEVMV